MVKPAAVFESPWKLVAKRKKVKKIPSSLVGPPKRRSKRKFKRFCPFQSPHQFNRRRKVKKVALRKLVLKPEVSKMKKTDSNREELVPVAWGLYWKSRLESLLRVLYKFKQFGIPNGEFTMMQLNQKIEEVNGALSRCGSKHFPEATQGKVKFASHPLWRGEAFGADNVFVNEDGVCIFCKKLPAMCNGDDLYAAIAASGRRLIKQGQFGEGSAVGRVERYPPMELSPYCPME